MTEADLLAEVRAARDAGTPVEVAGAGTLLRLLPGAPPCRRVDVAGLHGIASYDPADLRVTVRAGTRVDALAEALAVHGQECPIEGPGATVGGRVASGLSGIRRQGTGPLRDWVLGARIITARGAVVSVGGGTVKNVTGYDLVRLLCGSWGTLAVLLDVTLRVRPRPAFRQWYVSRQPRLDTAAIRCAASILRTRDAVHVLLEGTREDCVEQARRHGLLGGTEPRLPQGARLSVPPASVGEAVRRLGGEYVAEPGVGILHADPPADALPALRAFCESVGGRLLALRPDAGTPPFGAGMRDELATRVRHAFDPDGIFAPWRFAA